MEEAKGSGFHLKHVQELRRWYWQLPESVQAELSSLHQTRSGGKLYAATFAALWLGFGSATAFINWLPARLVFWAVAGASLHAMAILMHECNHGNFSRDRVQDRRFGFWLGLPGLVSGEAYRVMHLKHHRYNRTELDPDEFTRISSRPPVLRAAFLIWGAVGMPLYVLSIPFTAWSLSTAAEKKRIAFEYAGIAAIHSAFLAACWSRGAMETWRSLWAFPILFAVALGNVRGWAEHGLTDPSSPFSASRTVTSNRWISFFMCNLNYHREHHLFPNIPWYHLPRVHQLIENRLPAHANSTERSYLVLAGRVLRETLITRKAFARV